MSACSSSSRFVASSYGICCWAGGHRRSIRKLWAIDKLVNEALRNTASLLVRQYSPGEVVWDAAFVLDCTPSWCSPQQPRCWPSCTLPLRRPVPWFFARHRSIGGGFFAVVNGAGRSVAGCISHDRATPDAQCCASARGLRAVGALLFRVGWVITSGVRGLSLRSAGTAGGAFSYPLFASLVADYLGERNVVRNFGVVYSAKACSGDHRRRAARIVVASHGLTTPFVAAGLVQPARGRHDAAASIASDTRRRGCRDNAEIPRSYKEVRRPPLQKSTSCISRSATWPAVRRHRWVPHVRRYPGDASHRQ